MAEYRRWTPQEWRFLLKNKGVSFYEMHRRMLAAGFDRKIGGVRRMMDRMNMTKRRAGFRKWAPQEIRLLKELYPRASYEDLLKAFPFRSKVSIAGKAVYLGLRRPPRIIRTPEEYRARKRYNEQQRREKYYDGITHRIDRRIQT